MASTSTSLQPVLQVVRVSASNAVQVVYLLTPLLLTQLELQNTLQVTLFRSACDLLEPHVRDLPLHVAACTLTRLSLLKSPHVDRLLRALCDACVRNVEGIQLEPPPCRAAWLEYTRSLRPVSSVNVVCGPRPAAWRDVSDGVDTALRALHAVSPAHATGVAHAAARVALHSMALCANVERDETVADVVPRAWRVAAAASVTRLLQALHAQGHELELQQALHGERHELQLQQGKGAFWHHVLQQLCDNPHILRHAPAAPCASLIHTLLFRMTHDSDASSRWMLPFTTAAVDAITAHDVSAWTPSDVDLCVRGLCDVYAWADAASDAAALRGVVGQGLDAMQRALMRMMAAGARVQAPSQGQFRARDVLPPRVLVSIVSALARSGVRMPMLSQAICVHLSGTAAATVTSNEAAMIVPRANGMRDFRAADAAALVHGVAAADAEPHVSSLMLTYTQQVRVDALLARDSGQEGPPSALDTSRDFARAVTHALSAATISGALTDDARVHAYMCTLLQRLHDTAHGRVVHTYLCSHRDAASLRAQLLIPLHTLACTRVPDAARPCLNKLLESCVRDSERAHARRERARSTQAVAPPADVMHAQLQAAVAAAVAGSGATVRYNAAALPGVFVAATCALPHRKLAFMLHLPSAYLRAPVTQVPAATPGSASRALVDASWTTAGDGAALVVDTGRLKPTTAAAAWLLELHEYEVAHVAFHEWWDADTVSGDPSAASDVVRRLTQFLAQRCSAAAQ